MVASDIVGVQPMELPEGITFEDLGLAMETFLNGGNKNTNNPAQDTQRPSEAEGESGSQKES
jgi:hypothetical protein